MDRYEEHILDFNRQLNFKSLTAKNLEKLRKINPDAIAISGMGGSGLPQNIIVKLAPSLKIKTPIITWKDYGLNPLADAFKNPLFIFISFSGNTAETISGLMASLKKRKKTVAVITTGGKIKDLAERLQLPLVVYSAQGLTPREALGYNYYALIKVLRSIFPQMPVKDLSRKVRPAAFENAAKSIAKKIGSRITLIYTDAAYAHLGYIWKTNLNETAKLPAFNNLIPEVFHNEITAFEGKHYPFFVIFLIDKNDSRKILGKKITAMGKILKAIKIPNLTLKLRGKTKEEKTWNSIILSHLTAFHLAKFNKTNPTQTKLIDRLKKLTT